MQPRIHGTFASLCLVVLAACGASSDDPDTGAADGTGSGTAATVDPSATVTDPGPDSGEPGGGTDDPSSATVADTGAQDTGGEGSSEDGTTGPEPLGPPVPVPVSAHCPVFDDGPTPPPNPDLTRTLPGSTWDADGGCIYDAYYDAWPQVTMLGVEGEITMRLAFDEMATTDITVVLDYTEQIEIDRESFYYVPDDCDEVLRRLLGTSAETITHPVHPGYVADASSCTALDGTVCGCTLVTHYVEDHVNEGFSYVDGNAGVELTGGKWMMFDIEGDRMRLPFFDLGSPAVIETQQAVVELALQ